MGDRTYVSFTVNGHIATVAALDALCEAFVAEGVTCEGCGYSANADDFKTALGEAVMAGETTFLVEDEECNYADLSTLEAACQEHGIAYHFEWEAGGDYPAGQRSFLPPNGIYDAGFNGSGETTVSLADLQKALEGPDPLSAVKALANEGARAGGYGQPNLSASQEVKDHFAAWAEEDA